MLNPGELADFIERRMTMSHVYQPLVIRGLIEAGGTATLRQLALLLVQEDEPTVQQAEERLRNFPVKVLRKHGVIEYDAKRKVITLQTSALTFEQRAHLRMLCEQRLQQYRQQRGMSIWGELPATPAGRTLRYDVLAESGGRCALCGITAKDRLLDVDHIVPRSKGGRTEKANLQVLCSACNRAKRNRDDRDFREAPVERLESCPFCEMSEDRILGVNGSVFAVRDAHPATKSHTLVIPRRHSEDFFEMTQRERNDADDLARVLANELRDEDPEIAGFNIGYNAGTAAGQTVMHAHMHLIPRRTGDVTDPRGGIRGAIPFKMATNKSKSLGRDDRRGRLPSRSARPSAAATQVSADCRGRAATATHLRVRSPWRQGLSPSPLDRREQLAQWNHVAMTGLISGSASRTSSSRRCRRQWRRPAGQPRLSNGAGGGHQRDPRHLDESAPAQIGAPHAGAGR